MFFKFDLTAQRNPVGASHGDLRLQIGAAAINGTAMHGDEAKAAALVKRSASTLSLVAPA